MLRIFTVAAIAFCMQAHAELISENAFDYERLTPSQKSEFITYLYGTAMGALATQSLLESKDNFSLYCPPQKLTLSDHLFRYIFETEFKENKSRYTINGNKDVSAYIVLINGLINTFPCKGNASQSE